MASVEQNASSYLEGQFLIAMPNMGDPRFDRTVIFVCSHNEEGAMGLVVNKVADHITFAELLDQLDIDVSGEIPAHVPVHFGGPVETGRGFVLHSGDYEQASTLKVSDDLGLTATVDILRAMARQSGPDRALIALGYAGWGPGQLESEITQNGWLHCEADLDILFDDDMTQKWTRAIGTLGIDLSLLSAEAGHA